MGVFAAKEDALRVCRERMADGEAEVIVKEEWKNVQFVRDGSELSGECAPATVEKARYKGRSY